jgi:hypothetical protein
VCPGRRSRPGQAPSRSARAPRLEQLGAVDLVQCGRRNVEQHVAGSALAELVDEHREMVEQTVPARVHHREGRRIVPDGPQTRPGPGRDQEVRGARAFGGLVTKVARVQLHAFVRQRRRKCQLEGARVREQSL